MRYVVRQAILISLALVIASPSPASDSTATDGVFSVEDGSGRGLGLITLPSKRASTPGRSRTVFETPDGRILVALYQRVPAVLEWTSYRDAASGEELVVWSALSFAKSVQRLPTIFSFGAEVTGWSLEKQVNRAEYALRDEHVRSWLSARSPSFARLLSWAVEASIVAQRASIEPGNAGEYYQVLMPMIPLYSAFGSSQRERPAGTLRLLGPGSKESVRLLSNGGTGRPPSFPEPDVSRSWSGSLSGGREEPLGRLSLGWESAGKDGAIRGTIARLEWREGRREERAAFVFAGPAGGYLARLERRIGGDWSTAAAWQGFGEVEGDGWWVPFLVHDRMGQDRKPDGVEIPPSGDRERQRARSALLDAFLAAMNRSGLSEPEAAETLYRWQRIFNLPEVKESLPSIVPLADVLSDAPIPVFRNEADEPWAGTVDLRDVVTR